MTKIMKSQNKRGINVYIPVKEILLICNRFGIKKENFIKRKEDFNQIINEYFILNPEYKQCMNDILFNIQEFLE